MTRFSNDSLEIHGVLNGVNMSAAVCFRSLGQLAHNLGIQTIGPETGAPYRETRFIGEMRPEITGQVPAIKTLLDTLSLFGTNCVITDGGTRPGVRAFLQSHNACAPNARTAGSNHRRITVARSQIIITGIGGSRGQSATAQVRVIQLSADGTAASHVIVNNAALPTTFIADEEFVIGAPQIGSFAVAKDHIQSWNLETGITMTAIIGAGSIEPTVVDITKVAPRFVVQHDDPTLLDAAKIPDRGLACTLANTFFPLQKRAPMGGLVDAATTAHVKLNAAGFAYFTKHYDASGSATGTGEIVLECTEGVGGVPITVSSGVAL